MKYIITLWVTAITFFQSATAQDTTIENFNSPYRVSAIKDGAIIAGGVGLTALGVKLIDGKRNLTPAQLATKTPDKVPFFDRSSAGYYSQRADDDSYIPFQASFAMPVLMALINKNERHNLVQVLVLYTETMAITGSLFTMATGNIYRSSPLCVWY